MLAVPVVWMPRGKITEHLLGFESGEGRVHGLVTNEPIELVNVTVPVGGVGFEDLSVTVAVHVASKPASSAVGLHETVVVVGWRLLMTMLRLNVLVLPVWIPSPANVAVIMSVLATVPVFRDREDLSTFSRES